MNNPKDLFEALNKEKKQNESKLKLVKTGNLDSIIFGFENTLKARKNIMEDYFEFCKLSGPQTVTANDIFQFSLALKEYQSIDLFNRRAGLYLSALILKCTDKKITIPTMHLEKKISCLGHQNFNKHITINGDVEYELGSEMKNGYIQLFGNCGNLLGYNLEGGKIVIEGNAESHVGMRMRGGEIHIKKNAEHFVGSMLSKGTIIVNGNVGAFLGDYMTNGIIYVGGNAREGIGTCMKGGSIYLNGDYKKVSMTMQKGKIYHKWQLVVFDGKVII